MKICTNPACGAELDDCTDRCPECGRLQKTATTPEDNKDEPTKQTITLERHGFVSFWLGLIAIGNLLMAIINFLPKEMWGQNYPDDMVMYSYMCAVLNIITIIGAFTLLNWKRAGFYVILCSATINSIIGVALFHNIPTGLIGLVILWFVLKIKKNGISYWDAMGKTTSNFGN